MQNRSQIVKAVKEHYADLIAYFAQPHYKGRVKIVVVPVQTIGCIKFDSFSSSRAYEDGTPLPIFYPSSKVPAARQYSPRFLDQIVWHIVIHALQSAAAQDVKAADNFRKALPKIEKHIKKTEGFEVIQQGS